jgi:hypothetical protein
VSGNRGKICGVAAALAMAFAGCGGGDDSSSDEDEVREAIEQIAGSRDAGDCTTYATQAYLEQTTFETGAAAVEACEAQAGTTATVDVEDVAVDGDAATATVATTEGELEGQTVEVSLLREDNTWKLDSLNDFVVFDRGSYRDGLEERMVEDGTQAAALDCVLGNFDGLEDTELEQIFLSGDPNQLSQLAEGCA